MPKDKDRNLIYRNELEIANRAQKVLNGSDIDKEELLEEYRFLSEKYKKLLKEIIKLTRIGDMHYKKLMEANEQIEEHKAILVDLNRQLLEANAAKDKFYSIIAHDLKNPLQMLLFSSELMTNEYEKAGKESVGKYIEKVKNAALNMSHLLENLLQWGRSQYGEIDCTPQTIDLFVLAKENIIYLAENAEKKNVGLSLEIPANTQVYADENMIKSVLRNLISNAIKFSYPGGIIKIYSRDEGDFVVTSVSDTGAGIPADKLKLLFKLGEHFTTKGTAREKGSGLGLLLCKEFVEKNGGKIHVQSEEGIGSIFEFSLPANA